MAAWRREPRGREIFDTWDTAPLPRGKVPTCLTVCITAPTREIGVVTGGNGRVVVDAVRTGPVLEHDGRLTGERDASSTPQRGGSV